MGTALSISVCSNRPENLAQVGHLVDTTASVDEVVLVVDLDSELVDHATLAGLEARGVKVLRNDRNRGLSFSRNRALAECAHRFLVYVDDDIVLTSDTVEAIRAAVDDGASIVGVWLEPDFSGPIPWWLTGGQYHYLGVHHSPDLARTWGACMTIDTQLARDTGLRFREELGRRGKALQSGDDTTFIAELRAAGAREQFLGDAVAHHRVSVARTRLSYLLRRAWWQGRSEVRRDGVRTTIGKEWRRAVQTGPAATGPGRRHLLGVLYLSAVLSGVATEHVRRIAIRAGLVQQTPDWRG